MKAIDKIAILRDALRSAKRHHLFCDDAWHSCPKAVGGCADEREGSECNCGADNINRAIDKVLDDTKD